MTESCVNAGISTRKLVGGEISSNQQISIVGMTGKMKPVT